MSWLTRIFGQGVVGPERTTGRPTSSNGASSLHLFWDVPPVPLKRVSATLTVIDQPVVPELYFWALQASFVDGSRRTGGAHLGLQHHSSYPGSCAVNWGGYHDSGGELTGTESSLPSALGNVNTRDYFWEPQKRYRLTIGPGDRDGSGRPTGWRGSVTDVGLSLTTVVRDLDGGGAALASPMVWSEVFADCAGPPTSVLWSDPEVETMAGEVINVKSARTNYQTVADGGCSNTNHEAVAAGVLQRTAAERTVPPGALIRFG